MERNGGQQPGQRIADAERASGLERWLPGRTQCFDREQNETRRRTLGIGFERGKRRRRMTGQVFFTRVEQPVETRPRQAERTNGLGQGLDDLLAARLCPGINLGDRVAPPLQANAASKRLAHDLGNTGDLVIERIERKERFASLSRRE